MLSIQARLDYTASRVTGLRVAVAGPAKELLP